MIIFIVPGLRDTSPINWLVSFLLRLNDDLDIIVFSMDEDSYCSIVKERLSAGKITIMYGKGAGFLNFFLNLITLRKIIQASKPRVIFSQLIRADFLSSFLGTEIPRVASLRNMVDEEYIYSHGRLLGSVISRVHLFALRKIETVVAMSDGMRKRALELGVTNVTLIPNGLDTDIVDAELACCQPHNMTLVRVPRIIIVGSLTPRKQVREALVALWELHVAGTFLDITIVGSGPEEDSIIRFLDGTNSDFRSRVSILGHITNVACHLIQSDIFLMNSLSEGVSRALMEAMYLRLIVVVRKNDGSSELIGDRVNGYFFESTKHMKILLKDYSLTNAEFIQSELPKNCTMAANSQSYKELLRGLLGL
jgi:glycosyltransferase involved in cell wall biosynthesis